MFQSREPELTKSWGTPLDLSSERTESWVGVPNEPTVAKTGTESSAWVWLTVLGVPVQPKPGVP